jgi:integrase
MASKPFFEKRRGVWKCKYRRDPTGPWVTVTLCKHPPGTKVLKKPPQEAIDRAREFEEIEYRAKHGLGTAPARAKSLVVFLDGYVESQKLSARLGSAKQLARHVETFKEFASRQGLRSLQSVTKAHCRQYLEGRIKVVSHSTLRTERGYLIGAWTRAVDDGLLAINPWTKLPVPGKPVETSITFWSGDEIKSIAGACTKTWQQDLVLILANTAMRISTALAMEWSWIDWQEGSIKIPVGIEDVKTAYSLKIYRVARDVLQRRYATSNGSPLVFPNPFGDGGVIGYETARAAIDRSIARAKVKHGTPHDLRHSCARNMILANVPITVVQRQLGHTTIAMTMKYVSADAATSAKYEDFGIGD